MRPNFSPKATCFQTDCMPTTARSTAGPATQALAPASAADVLRLDNQLCFALYATSLAMTKVYRPLLAEIGLTYPQYLVMLALWQHGTLSAGALGEQVALDSGTLVPLVRKLVATGLVTRQRSAQDDRSVQISLTPAGLALQARAQTVQQHVGCATRCSAEQRQALNSSLRSLRAALLQGAPELAPWPAR